METETIIETACTIALLLTDTDDLALASGFAHQALNQMRADAPAACSGQQRNIDDMKPAPRTLDDQPPHWPTSTFNNRERGIGIMRLIMSGLKNELLGTEGRLDLWGQPVRLSPPCVC